MARCGARTAGFNKQRAIPLGKLSASLLLSFLFSACLVSESEHQALKDSKKAVEASLKELKEEAKIDRARIKDLEKGLSEKEQELEEIKEVKTKLESLEKEQLKTKEDFEAYKKKYRLETRNKAAGEQLESLLTRDGRTYNKVTVRSVVPDGIHVLHETGGAKILFAQLDPSWSERFDFDPSEAEVYAKEISQKRNDIQTAQSQLQSSATSSEQTLPASSPANQVSAASPPANDAPSQKLALLRQELRVEISSVLAKIKEDRREHFNENGAAGKGTYIKLKSYNRYTGENNSGGGKKPGAVVDLENGLNEQYPENSTCLDNVSTTMIMSRARDLRSQIIALKNQHDLN